MRTRTAQGFQSCGRGRVRAIVAGAFPVPCAAGLAPRCIRARAGGERPYPGVAALATSLMQGSGSAHYCVSLPPGRGITPARAVAPACRWKARPCGWARLPTWHLEITHQRARRHFAENELRQLTKHQERCERDCDGTRPATRYGRRVGRQATSSLLRRRKRASPGWVKPGLAAGPPAKPAIPAKQPVQHLSCSLADRVLPTKTVPPQKTEPRS